MIHCSHRLYCVEFSVKIALISYYLFNKMILAWLLWGFGEVCFLEQSNENMQKNQVYEIFESALYSKSVSRPLSSALHSRFFFNTLHFNINCASVHVCTAHLRYTTITRCIDFLYKLRSLLAALSRKKSWFAYINLVRFFSDECFLQHI